MKIEYFMNWRKANSIFNLVERFKVLQLQKKGFQGFKSLITLRNVESQIKRICH